MEAERLSFGCYVSQVRAVGYQVKDLGCASDKEEPASVLQATEFRVRDSGFKGPTGIIKEVQEHRVKGTDTMTARQSICFFSPSISVL